MSHNHYVHEQYGDKTRQDGRVGEVAWPQWRLQLLEVDENITHNVMTYPLLEVAAMALS